MGVWDRWGLFCFSQDFFSKGSLGEPFEFYHSVSKGRREVQNMQSALDRRQAITEVLSDRRFETIENLMAEFGVSRSTIKRDLEILGCSVPIYTVQGNGGGIRVADGWYAGRRYLRSEQEELLCRLMDGLQPDDQRVMQSILASFAKPKVKEQRH